MKLAWAKHKGLVGLDVGDCQCDKRGTGIVLKVDLDSVVSRKVECSDCGAKDHHRRKFVKIVDRPDYDLVMIEAIEIDEGPFDPNTRPE